MHRIFQDKNRLKLFLLIAIISLSFFFRLYKIHDWLSWGMDQEYEAFLAKNIITLKHFPLIGVNASDTGLYLGPAFIYFAAIPFAIFGGNPLGWGITASLIGIFVTYLVYKVGKEMFSHVTGLFASFLYAGSFLMSFYDRQFWNPTLVPFFSLILGFLLFRILKKEVNKLIWLALVFGLAIQSHLSLLIFLPLILYVFLLKRKEIAPKILIWSCVLFLLTQLPLIIFELRHDLLNTRSVIKLVANRNSNVNLPSTWEERNSSLLSSLGRFFWVPAPVDFFTESGQCKELTSYKRNSYPESIILVFAGILIFGFWYFGKSPKNKNKHAGIIIGGLSILTFIFTEFYNRSFFEYYLLFLFPWLAIILGQSLAIIWHKKHGFLVVTAVVALFISLNLFTLFTAKYSFSYKDKISAINFVKSSLYGEKYSLEALGECPRFGGFRYLFEYKFTVPLHSYMDSYFAWLYPDMVKDNSSGRIVLLSLIDDRMRADLIAHWEIEKTRLLSSFNLVADRRFGKIHVLILSPK